MRLLIVEDDSNLGSSFSNSLTKDGFNCRLVSSGAAAVEASKKDEFQVVILDLTLDSSIETVHQVRKINPKSNILLLAPLESRQQRYAALEAGADDFIFEPFELGEMRARVEAALIRSKYKSNSQRLEHGPLVMDIVSRKVTFHGKTLSLTPTEFRILGELLQTPGKVVSRQMIHESLWELGWDGVTNVIEVHINRLRSKMRVIADQTVIRTVRGSGYMIDIRNVTRLA